MKTIKVIQLLLVASVLGMSSAYGQFSQTLLSESWVKPGGPGMLVNNSTTTDFYRNVYVAGSTIVGPNNTDIIIQKFDPNGMLIWQQTYAGSANLNDAATDVFVDVNYNVYITGTVVNSVNDGQDIIVVKYNSNGTQQWVYTYHGSNTNIDDGGVAIVCDAGGNEVFVTGTSGDNQNYYDFNTFSLNSSNGGLNWMQSYDYASELEIPKRLFLNGGSVYVVGASQDDPNHWEIATVAYDQNNGAFLFDERTNSNNISGIDELNDFAVDNQGNIYLIGSINLNGDYDIAVYKLDASLNLVWENFYDVHGMDDKGNGIEVFGGEIYLTGSATTNNSGTDVILMKLNNSGTNLWTKEVGGRTGQNDFGKKLVIDSNGKIYVAAATDDGNNLDSRLYCFDGNSNLIATKSYNGANNLHEIPQDIHVDLDDNIIVTSTEEVTTSSIVTKTAKYRLFERDYNYAYNSGSPSHLKGSILIRFHNDVMIGSNMNSRKFHAGRLDEFIETTTISVMQVKTGHDWGKYSAYKVLKYTTPDDSISITRLGDTIKANDLWTYLSVDIPENDNHIDICDSLKTLNDHIREAELNVLFELYDTPNDMLYANSQYSLYESTQYPGASINAEDAWDEAVGISTVKVGIVDSPIDWAHEEFNNGVLNLPASDKKVGGGWNYTIDDDINNDYLQGYPHGTKVAGIIGARRNNYVSGNSGPAIGISGIAGGDGPNNSGVQLFSLGISTCGPPACFVPLEIIADAIEDGYSDSPTNDKHLGLHIMNGSWGSNSENAIPLLTGSIKECWRNHCVYIAARGQHTSYNGAQNTVAYPACFNDLYLINVIASGTDGERANYFTSNGVNGWSSNYGMSGQNQTPTCSADVMAPGVPALINSTSPYDNYGTFDGTSASAPHVTGVAALMYGVHTVSNGYPNNLGTEDIENILESTATDKGVTGFDLESGFGLVNADLAVLQVKDPYYVKHLTSIPNVAFTNNISVTIYGGSSSPALHPLSKKYVVNWDVDVTLPNGHEIINWWELKAAMVKGGQTSASTTNITMGSTGEFYNSTTIFDPIGMNSNHIHRTASMVTYLLNGNDSDPNNDVWFPHNPYDLKYYFSVHVKKSADASLDEVKSDNFILYPNPAEDYLILSSIVGNNIDKYEILDMSGRVLETKTNNSKNDIKINLSGFSRGMYYIRVYSEVEFENLPFVKK